MAYYLVVKNKDCYRALDVTRHERFKRMSNFKGSNYSLEEIDNFTSKFDDEIVFKSALCREGFITPDEILADILVMMKSKGSLKNVEYGPVYADRAAFLDSKVLQSYLVKLESDCFFLKKLVNRYASSYSSEYLRTIREYLRTSCEEEMSKMDSLLEFYYHEVYRYERDNNSWKVKYKSLHDLGMFVYSYISTKGKCAAELAGLEYGRKASLKCLRESFLDKKDYPKRRVLRYPKNKEIDGQLSFEDLD